MQRAVEGQAREVRGEGKDGEGGDKHEENTNNGNDKIIALTPPAIQEITINRQWWQPVGGGGRSGQWRGRWGKEGRRGRWQRGGERNKAGVINRAGGNKKQQSADDGDDRERGREDSAGNWLTGEGGKARWIRLWGEEGAWQSPSHQQSWHRQRHYYWPMACAIDDDNNDDNNKDDDKHNQDNTNEDNNDDRRGEEGDKDGAHNNQQMMGD